jgi:hypothetical protein
MSRNVLTTAGFHFGRSIAYSARPVCRWLRSNSEAKIKCGRRRYLLNCRKIVIVTNANNTSTRRLRKEHSPADRKSHPFTEVRKEREHFVSVGVQAKFLGTSSSLPLTLAARSFPPEATVCDSACCGRRCFLETECWRCRSQFRYRHVKRFIQPF